MIYLSINISDFFPLHYQACLHRKSSADTCKVVEINSGTQEKLKCHIQDTTHAQKHRALVHKQVTHTVATITLILFETRLKRKKK